MTIKRMDHVGVVVHDLAAAVEFFVELGLVLEGETTVEGEWADRVLGLDGIRADIAYFRSPDGHGALEVSTFDSPPLERGDPHAPPSTPGIRHIAFVVDDIDDVVGRLRARGVELVSEPVRYEDIYRLCYVRGPEGILVELAEELG